MLDELIQLTILDEESPQSFKVRAYEKAKAALENHPEDFTSLSVSQLTKIPGVGKATATKVRELLDAGSVAKLETLRAQYPPEFARLSRIPGLGPKTLKLVRGQLGVEDLDGLKAAIDAQQLRTLPRMGATSEAKIGRAIERLGLTGKHDRAPAADAFPVAEQVAAALRALPSVTDVLVCGSLRRMAETVGDVDITVAATEPTKVLPTIGEQPSKLGVEVREVLAAGDTKMSVLTAGGLQIDIRVVDPSHFGATTLYFTGSKAHNVALRQRAIDRGLLLNEYGLSPASDPQPTGVPQPEQPTQTPPTSSALAASTEAEIYAALDLAYIPAPMREATGEVEAAADGTLPTVVQRRDIRGDLHYHTDRSGDGRSSLADMVAEAASHQLEYLAITDHGEDLAINGSNRLEMLAHRDAIRQLQPQYPAMTLLYGCELNIGPEGGLDYDAEFRASFDYTVASVHSHFDLPVRAQTARMVAAIADPTVDSIGHLTGRYIGRRPGIEIDIDIVLEALYRFDVALEINGSLHRLDAGADVVRRAVRRGVKLVINTDSHHTSELGRMEYGVLTAQRGWAPRDLVINTWPRDRFLRWVNTHRTATKEHLTP